MSTLKVTNIAPQSGTNVYLTGSLTISETLIAKEVRTELTQSVTLFQSGSTQFGDTADDTHAFTGDVTVTGALGITGYADLSASLSTNDTSIAALQTDSASFSTRLTTAESELGNSLLSSSAQIADDISGSFVAASSSIATDIDALQLFSSSLDATYATDAQLNTATASLSSSLATDIATRALTANISGSFTSTSASIATDIAANTADIVTLTGETGSYALSANVVANESTASFASTGSNTFSGNQIVSASVLLTLQQLTGSMPTGVATGSLIVSGSPVQLYIYNGSGSGWNRV